MFNFSILATRAAPTAFWQMRPFAGVLGVRMVNILAVRKKFKVFQFVIGAVKVFMINLKSARNFAIKGFPYQSMNRTPKVNAITAQIYRKIVFYRLRRQRSVCFVAAPSLAVFNGEHGGYTGVQERRNVRQFTPVSQHFFGLNNLFGGKFFSPRNTAHIAKIADFVQCLVPKHRFPNFHKMSPLTSYNPIPNFIKGQA